MMRGFFVLICGLYLLLWAGWYTNSVFYHGQGGGASILFWSLGWLFSTYLNRCRYLAVADFCAASSWFPFAHGIPGYFELSWTLAVCLTKLVAIILPLFDIIRLHLSSPSDKLTSVLEILDMWISVSTSHLHLYMYTVYMIRTSTIWHFSVS